jgi:hypothetical protein
VNLTEVMPSALGTLGADGFRDSLGIASITGPVRRLAVLLVDGLGHHLLPRAAASSPLLADVVAGTIGSALELASTLPSTTPTSLVSLATGALPGRHGVVGFTVRVPGTDRVLTHIRWADDPDPRTWQPVPTVYERSSVPCTVVLPAVFRGTGLTVSAYRGADFVPLGSRDDAAGALLAAVRARPGLVFGYASALDTAAHVYGIASPQWATAATRIGELIERIVAGLPPDAALLVTADHGGLDVPAGSRVDLADDPRLSAGLRLVAGEPRFRYLHTVDGATGDVAATWSAVLGSRAAVYERDEAVATGMFGPVPGEHLARIGDVVVVCRDDLVVLASGHEPPEVAALVGFHGSTAPAETAIPLLVLGARP